MPFLNLPNSLSLSRIVLAIAGFLSVCEGLWPVAAICTAVAIGTDLLDGYVARRRSIASPLGGFIDHACDALFVSIILVALGLMGIVTLLLPPLVVVAFSQYALDSRALQGRPLRASTLGRYNGLAYYAVPTFVVFQQSLGILSGVLPLIYWLSVLLCLTTIVSMLDRLRALLRG
jgi:phosphatidylglycerophosphate synthase